MAFEPVQPLPMAFRDAFAKKERQQFGRQSGFRQRRAHRRRALVPFALAPVAGALVDGGSDPGRRQAIALEELPRGVHVIRRGVRDPQRHVGVRRPQRLVGKLLHRGSQPDRV